MFSFLLFFCYANLKDNLAYLLLNVTFFSRKTWIIAINQVKKHT